MLTKIANTKGIIAYNEKNIPNIDIIARVHKGTKQIK